MSSLPISPVAGEGAGACANNTIGVMANSVNVNFFIINRTFSLFISNTFYKI